MNKKKASYLSHRVAALAIAAALFSACGLAACGIAAGGAAARLVCAGAVGLAAFCAAGWFWVVLPYRRLELHLRQIAAGHTYGSNRREDEAVCLSPASERVMSQAAAVLSPSKLFHLNKRQAQYMALQNQINPHFLYNTLESIRSEALIAQLGSVADMTEALAMFFRYTISKVENLVSVEEELQNCETYFRIQQYRFGERLCLKIECDPEDREHIFRCRLPKLTLQPILENSIIHGTEEKLGTSHITISLALTDQHLLLRISDDGAGMDEETLARLNARFGRQTALAEAQEQATGGVALVNVDHRIRLLFGEEYGLHVYSLLGSGTDAELMLPAITSDREIKNREALQ